MTNPSNHAGSGIDKAHPKTVGEKISDGIKSVLPQKSDKQAEQPSGQTGIGTIVPPAD